jgi:hypothetical protein
MLLEDGHFWMPYPATLPGLVYIVGWRSGQWHMIWNQRVKWQDPSFEST